MVGFATALANAGSNFVGLVTAVLQLLWDVGIQLLQKVIVATLQNGDFFTMLGETFALGSDIVPGVIGVKLALWGIGTMIGAAGLAAESCLPGM
jgi:hypothetical protein